MTDTPSYANVLTVYNRATADNLRWGLMWYPTAHREALRMGHGSDRYLKRNAGIIAALSPMNGWTNNVRKAQLLISLRGKVTAQKGIPNGIGLSDNVAKAIDIYNGAEPLDILGGDKVRSFYRTILDPTGDFDPVIDRHAFDIAVGEVTNDRRRQALSRKGAYHQFGMAYRRAANLAGISPSQMQAITWVQWREEKGIA